MLPQLLKKGDIVVILAPAKGIEKDFIDFAVETIEKKGLKALVSQNCLGQHNYFSGTIKERVEDLQWAINNEDVKAILCARGGYGCIQLLDRINWQIFLIIQNGLLVFLMSLFFISIWPVSVRALYMLQCL